MFHSILFEKCNMCFEHKNVRMTRLAFERRSQSVYICNDCLWFYTWIRGTKHQTITIDSSIYEYCHHYPIVPDQIRVIAQGDVYSQYKCEYAEFVTQMPGTYLEWLPRDMVKTMLRPVIECTKANDHDREVLSVSTVVDLTDADIDCTNGKRQCVRGTIRLRHWIMCKACRNSAAKIV